MVMESIDVTKISEFSANFHAAAQQEMSRTNPYAKLVQMNSDRFYYDGIGTADPKKITSRNSPAVADEIEFNRRLIKPERFVKTLWIDRNDIERMLADPQSQVIDACVKGFKRQADRVFVAALDASVKTGREGETTVTAANDGVITVDATAGLTYAKLLEVNQNFINNEVAADGNARTALFISGDENTTMMNQTNLISGDFTRQFAVERGSLVKAVGMDVVLFGANTVDPILPVSGGVRSCFAIAENAVVMGMVRELQIKVQERTDLIDTVQIVITAVYGAVRTEGKLVQKVNTTD